MNSPFVSVLLPVFNGEKYIRKTIESILDQTFDDFEFIIINDCSTDLTEQIILSFTDSRIRYISHTKNMRLIYTLNEGIAIARGKYLARIDADDIAFKERLNEQVQFLEKHPAYVLLGTQIKYIKHNVIIPENVTYFTDDADLRFAMCFYNPFVHPSVILRLETVRSNNLFFEQKNLHAEDYAFWIRISKYGKIANLEKVLTYYRIHDNQISVKNASFQKEQMLRIQKEYCLECLSSYTLNEIEILFNLGKNSDLHFKYYLLLKFWNNSSFFGSAKDRYVIENLKNLLLESHKIPIRIGFDLLFTKRLLFCRFTSRQLFSIIFKALRFN